MDNSHVSKNSIRNQLPNNYLQFIEEFGLNNYRQMELWYEIGPIPQLRGWIFYIPISEKDISLLLERVIPYVISQQIGLKIPHNKLTHHLIKEGYYGQVNHGKIICIYPAKTSNLVQLARKLIEMTSGLAGTTVPSSICLGNLVFTRYGEYESISTPEGEFIYNNSGELVVDLYTIPYHIPNWLKWPFDEIVSSFSTSIEKVVKNKYFFHEILRDSYKGRIIHGLYTTKLIWVNHCLIKEGRKGMFSDEEGRDIIDRLLWQRELHIKLSEFLPIPKFIDFFSEGDKAYLITEFIKGETLERYVESIFMFNTWTDLKTKPKLRIVDLIIELTQHLDKLHQNGYVHRDITISNFMVKNGSVYLVDLELAYSLKLQQPNPPFQIGTEGYMSPEQEGGRSYPSVKQDIYSLGAIMLAIFSRLSPKKFLSISQNQLNANLLFFTSNKFISQLITSCLDSNPDNRPALKDIEGGLLEYRRNANVSEVIDYSSASEINSIVLSAIRSLNLSSLLNTDGEWVSQVSPSSEIRYVLIGFQKGISGIIYCLSKAKGIGIDINANIDIFENNLKFLKDRFLSSEDDLPVGFYNGSAGVAMALSSAMDYGLIPVTEEYKNYVFKCLYRTPIQLNLSDGLAGYGRALIASEKYLSSEFVNERFSLVINSILKSQLSNGSWLLPGKNLDQLELIGFENGISGIIWFLLECYKITRENNLRSRIILGLNWLSKQKRKINNEVVWPIHSSTKDGTLFLNGNTGVALTFLKAYEEIGDVSYRQIAQLALSTLPEKAIINDHSFSIGMSGLGEVYLEAYKVLGDIQYLKRAEWLVNVFTHSYLKHNGTVYWIQNQGHYPSPDLMSGNCGIIYFLLRYIHKEKLNFLLE